MGEIKWWDQETRCPPVHLRSRFSRFVLFTSLSMTVALLLPVQTQRFLPCDDLLCRHCEVLGVRPPSIASWCNLVYKAKTCQEGWRSGLRAGSHAGLSPDFVSNSSVWAVGVSLVSPLIWPTRLFLTENDLNDLSCHRSENILVTTDKSCDNFSLTFLNQVQFAFAGFFWKSSPMRAQLLSALRPRFSHSFFKFASLIFVLQIGCYIFLFGEL